MFGCTTAREPQRYDHGMNQKGTGNYSYRRLRAAFLAGNPPCAWCGRAPGTTVDHLVPIDAGAVRNDVTNWVAACKSCNSRRGALYLAAKRKGLPETPARARIGKPCIGWSR